MTGNTDRWLLPDGLEELLPEQAEVLERLHRELLDTYRRWGYQQVVPPLVEFIESLLTGTGHDLDLSTFRLTDPVTGRQMGIRADMTPQAARIDAHALKREHPVRLCYLGTVLRTRPEGFSGSRAPMQVGCELFGHAGPESVLEVIELMLETLRVTGIGDVVLDLGHVLVYRGLARQAALDEDAEARLFDILQRKANPELETLLAELALTAPVANMLRALTGLNGDVGVIARAREVLAGAGEQVSTALDELEQVAALLARDHPEVALHVDLAELRGYHYHSGIVFAAFKPGYGEEIARGGRYDGIGRVFGRDRPATGFSADLRTLIHLSDQLPEPATGLGILAPPGDAAELREAIRELREAGEVVVHALPGAPDDPHLYGCNRRLVRTDGGWQVSLAD